MNALDLHNHLHGRSGAQGHGSGPYRSISWRSKLGFMANQYQEYISSSNHMCLTPRNREMRYPSLFAVLFESKLLSFSRTAIPRLPHWLLLSCFCYGGKLALPWPLGHVRMIGFLGLVYAALLVFSTC